MAKRSIGFIGCAAALLTLGLLLPGCVGPMSDPGRGSGWDRPDPTAIVDEYVDAIAAGDAERAREIDAAAVAAAMDERARYGIDLDETELLRTDAVLQSAVMIENTEIELNGHPTRGDEARVDVAEDIGSRRESTTLILHWNRTTEEWELATSMAYPLMIFAEKAEYDDGPALFRIGAVPDVVEPGSDPHFAHLAYPGIYTVSAEFPIELMRSPSDAVQEVSHFFDGECAELQVTEVPHGSFSRAASQYWYSVSRRTILSATKEFHEHRCLPPPRRARLVVRHH